MDKRIYQVEFIEDKHEYWFVDTEGHHRQLNGITSAIGKLLGKNFPDTDIVHLASIYGLDVHKEVENYFNLHGNYFNDSELSSEGAKWVVETLKDFCSFRTELPASIECEVMVSDFEGTASKVDVVVRERNGKAWLFDIKTTSKFDREYCSLQLSVYKELYERCYDEKVEGLYVLGTKAKRSFRIINQDESRVKKILEMNKKG